MKRYAIEYWSNAQPVWEEDDRFDDLNAAKLRKKRQEEDWLKVNFRIVEIIETRTVLEEKQ